MSDIKPAEVSAILKKQLEGLSLNSKMDEVGTQLVPDEHGRIKA